LEFWVLIMETNVIKNAIRNVKTSIAMEEKNKIPALPTKTGLLSRGKNDKISDVPQEHDSVRFAKMIRGKFNNA